MMNIINIFSYSEINKLKTSKNKDSLNDVIKNDFISFLGDILIIKSFILNGEMDMEVIKSFLYFILAGFCEIGGGYLIWLWLRDGGSFWVAIVGGAILVLYGIVATFQPANFGRVYAAYGGVFIVMAILWGWQVDKVIPDRFDIIGGIICLIGMLVIMYWPRN